MTKKSQDTFKLKSIVDAFIFAIFFTNICVTFITNLRNTISEGPTVVNWRDKAPIYCRNYVENFTNEHSVLIMGLVALWLRVITLTSYNTYLGKFLGVVRRLITEIFLFFALYLINLIAFSLVAESALMDLPEYNPMSEAFKTLFFSSFGTFDFDAIEQARLGPRFGIFFLVVFLIINIGLFMSLFVSIITVLFREFQRDENIYQMLDTLAIRPTTEADKSYSILISVPAPFNLVLFFVAPFLLSSPNPQKINERWLMITYTPILLATAALYVAGEVALWPFVYIKMVFHKLTMVWVYSKSYRVSRADKFASFITYLIVGPFVTIGNSVVDLQYFLRHMIQFELQKIKHKTRHQLIEKRNLEIIS